MPADRQRSAAAAAFATRWQGRGYEKGDSQSFWLELLAEVFGIVHTSEFIRFEEQVKVDATNFIDGHIPSTRVLIEQKSLGTDLRKGIRQADGSLLNPFQQAKRYVLGLPVSQHPRWIVTCNFAEFLVYDMEQPNGEPEHILLRDLGREYYRLQFLVDERSEHLSKEMRVSMQAGEIVGRIYDALKAQYRSAGSPAGTTGDNASGAPALQARWLNILCVRLVFCLYAEDAGVFAHNQFHDYLFRYDPRDLRRALLDLFGVLNTPIEQRSQYLPDDLRAFPYTNGGLFAEPIEIPQFTDELKMLLLSDASSDFDWSEISPTIFGAVFESTLNPDTRRAGGMHYTSIENIHKVIDPLFLDGLRRELDAILGEKVERTRNRRLDEYRGKLASLTFLDPACGSGNFLTETYLSLRRLENEAIRERYHGQSFLGMEEASPVQVSIQQFYGIEINDFAVTVATTALWISEAQMLRETERIIKHDIDFLPLRSYTNIREGNALRMDWDIIEQPSDVPTIHARNVHLIIEDIPSPRAGEDGATYGEVNIVTQHLDNKPPAPRRYEVHYDYIIGNPPFVGARMMDEGQKQDMLRIFGKRWPNVGNMDYVCCWYKKAFDLIRYGTGRTRAALVSTNSICQGEQVANLWQPLMEMGLHINFAHRSFRWDSESSNKAQVHCVIIGFSAKDWDNPVIFENGRSISASHINAYLMDAPDVFVQSRPKPICDVPEVGMGNQPIDNGNYLFDKDEMEAFVKIEPESAAYFHPYYGAVEFTHSKPRYCLWLGDCPPNVLHRMPHCLKRIEAVKHYRLSSKRLSTLKLADSPTRFQTENMPKTPYIVIPEVTTQRRKYIPMGMMTPDVICSNKLRLLPDVSLYHFGVLMSNVHMAWMRAVCGRMKSDYSYSINVVYNNFPWPKEAKIPSSKEAKIPSSHKEAKMESSQNNSEVKNSAPLKDFASLIVQTAQAILDARALYPDASLADLYDDLTMPPELRRAHQQNDRAVMAAYGFPTTMTESQCVAELFRLYQQLTAAH